MSSVESTGILHGGPADRHTDGRSELLSGKGLKRSWDDQPQFDVLPLRKAVLATGFRTLRALGAFTAASRRRNKSLLILCYHGLSLQDEHKWWPHLYITPAQFRSRLQSLRAYDASVLPLGEALDRLKSGCLPPRSVCITFDDGFYDFLQHGLPILAEFKMPCTLYLTTHYCENRYPIISLILDYMLWKSTKEHLYLPHFGFGGPIWIGGAQNRQIIVQHLLDHFERRRMNTAGKDQIARSMAERLDLNYETILNAKLLQILSPSDVQHVARAGVDVQLHTHRHRTPKDHNLFKREIEENKSRIVDLTRKTPSHFCYPSGQYAPQYFDWLKEFGVESATTCESGLVSKESEAMCLPRILDDSGMTKVRFESVLSGLFV